ncbi:MAG: hypothetical protein B6241_09140 [Spirochaetaceae bacterium 4572_59]|nr:MAG: hypothetical protein B6241_09140 [Spirochaetaceae bacterium 4572_59]
MEKTGRLLFLTLFLLGLVFSCKKEVSQWNLVLPPTPILTGTTGWGVVNTAYLKINSKPDNDQFVVTTLREGDIVKIDSIHYLKDKKGYSVTIWYNISWEKLNGWVKESYLDSYETREKAETGSRMLLN